MTGPHLPLRPLWLCRDCAAPWPCPAARLTLLREYATDRVSLLIHLGGLLHDAAGQLHTLHPDGGPAPTQLFARFLGWAIPRRAGGAARPAGLAYDPGVIDERFALPAAVDERTLLDTFLDFQRDALVRKCAGLADEQLRLRPVPSSGLSLIGLVRHLATVERWYFQAVIADAFPGDLFDLTDDEDAPFTAIAEVTGTETFAIWREEVAVSRRIAAERPLDAVGRSPGTGLEHSLRWVLAHMIDEYARHLGHADILREAIDGRTGE
ncbi:DinB family protein [Micromonospora sp. MS34]|uniref:DinB family protein n=1 Tax=Micromonospora sp. MS34 TaxID=3385971 RepID=UPI0039A0929F